MITSCFKKHLPSSWQGIHMIQGALCPPREISGLTVSVSVYSWESFQLEASLGEEAVCEVHKAHQKLQKCTKKQKQSLTKEPNKSINK